ncbi:hypothetical protein HD806DRAFT_522681 [Xylariaceae sp. AK1471]|nr:hypothetical protein HD806DRAFT_522681 [Xylariaceae sp. AK1471]
MAGLIPLLLQTPPGSRSSIGFPSAESRRRSCLSRPSPSSEPSQSHRRQQSLPLLRQAKRVSLTAPPALMAMPSTALEWKMAIDEVKRKYVARKYRSCSMQCCEILDSLEGDASATEPLHLIYLHFYAASSFEWCARPLSSSSAYRTKLLRDAQVHYAEAEALIKATEYTMAERARSPSEASTISPRSPGLSACSRTSGSSSSATSSPRTSVFFPDDETPTPAPAQPVRPRARVKPKKKVSFSSLPEFFEFQPEPYIRPDSPTLGWTDGLSFEEKMTPLPLRLSARTTIPATRPEPADENTTVDQDYNQERSSTPSNHVFDLESFLQTRSLNRFCARLSALRDQVCRHRAAVDDLLADTHTPAAPPAIPSEAPSHTPITPTPLSAGASENLQERIERLRASGWRRRRFDSRRYEALREQALGELEPCC